MGAGSRVSWGPAGSRVALRGGAARGRRARSRGLRGDRRPPLGTVTLATAVRGASDTITPLVTLRTLRVFVIDTLNDSCRRLIVHHIVVEVVR